MGWSLQIWLHIHVLTIVYDLLILLSRIMTKMLQLLIFGILLGAVEPRSVSPILLNTSERDFYYTLESVFENALDLSNVSGENSYKLQSGFAAILNSNSPLQCVPVRYVIVCDKPSSNCTDETMVSPECACANETANYYYETWQWTSFRMDFAGDFIITWSRIGFVAFGFHWNRYCKFAAEDIIQLQIHLPEFPPVSESLQRTHEALNSLTRTVVRNQLLPYSGKFSLFVTLASFCRLLSKHKILGEIQHL